MIQPGDIFVVQSPSIVSRLITGVTGWWSLDGNAEYSHSGIILDADGNTFESRRRIGRYHLSDFNGRPMLIGRHRLMNERRYKSAIAPLINEFEGDIYPYWRLALHLIPPLARCIGTGGFLVCSELVARFLNEAGLMQGYRGWNPDNVADMICKWKLWTTVFKGDCSQFANSKSKQEQCQ